jgi:hypothetical protein
LVERLAAAERRKERPAAVVDRVLVKPGLQPAA